MERAAKLILGSLVVGIIAGGLWFWWAVSEPFPRGRLGDTGQGSTIITDRYGEPLREVRDRQGGQARWVSLDEISPWLIEATLASEDHRFREHPGVDAWAVARAAKLWFETGRVYSGASTLTMQLVRITAPEARPRTLGYKVDQALLALRLEQALTKDEILGQYLNRLPYGNGAFGAEAASRLYLGKPARDLSLAEATLLATLPRSPTWYNPRRHMDRARERQRHILGLMLSRGVIDEGQYETAVTEPITLEDPLRAFEAPHFVAWMTQRHPALMRTRPQRLRTSLDIKLQRAAEHAVERALSEGLRNKGATQSAAIVLDNGTGELLAMVGSADWEDVSRSGRFNGATAPRPTGTNLTPFVYATAFESGMTLAEVLADVPTRVKLADGRELTPLNHDGHFRGPVRARVALSGSLEVPALQVLGALGNEAIFEDLHALGLKGLDRVAIDHGLIRSKGLGRASLLQLTSALSTFSTSGTWHPPTAVLSAHHAKRIDEAGQWRPLPVDVFSPQSGAMVTEALSDDEGRRDAPPLIMPFPVALTFGSSDGGRDLWVMGYTPQVSVGVWVGRFDGRSWSKTHPIEAGGQIFKEIMNAAMVPHRPRLFEQPENFALVDICPLSGLQAGPDCPHSTEEIFAPGEDPTHICTWHVAVKLDRRNGFEATSGCEPEHVTTHTHVRLPPGYEAWIWRQGLRTMKRGRSPLCTVTGEAQVQSPASGPLYETPLFPRRTRL